MHPTYSQLCADHYNFLRLLRHLETEIAAFDNDPGNQACLATILDIFDYVQHYPEQWHHPVEDLVFDVLIAKQGVDSERFLVTKAEHKSLEALTRRASELFTAVANDTVVPKHHLISSAREFITRQIEHIARENSQLYPLMASVVSDSEWDRIREQINNRRDPLFDQAIKSEYRSLYKSIMQSEDHLTSCGSARQLKHA